MRADGRCVCAGFEHDPFDHAVAQRFTKGDKKFEAVRLFDIAGVSKQAGAPVAGADAPIAICVDSLSGGADFDFKRTAAGR